MKYLMLLLIIFNTGCAFSLFTSHTTVYGFDESFKCSKNDFMRCYRNKEPIENCGCIK